MVPPGFPQGASVALPPPMQAVEGVSSAGFDVLASPAGWDSKDAARQHQQLTPGLLIIVVDHSREGSGEGLAPQVPGRVGHMPEGWSASVLDVPKGWQIGLGLAGVRWNGWSGSTESWMARF